MRQRSVRVVRVVRVWIGHRMRYVHHCEHVLTLAIGTSVAGGFHYIEVLASGSIAVLMALALLAAEEDT